MLGDPIICYEVVFSSIIGLLIISLICLIAKFVNAKFIFVIFTFLLTILIHICYQLYLYFCKN
jgi:hypothetical protein